jgi:branched-chain amino acid transport system substrate-binding protein
MAAGCGDGKGGGDTTATSPGGSGEGPVGDPIVIGAIVSTSGPASPLGEPERNTMQLLERQINEAGGVLGRPLKIVILDDQSNAKEAVTAANRLLQQDKAVAIIAASASATTLAVKPITAKAGVPQIAMAASNAITDEAPNEWMFRVAPKDDLAVNRALEYIAEELGASKMVVLYDENAFGSSGLAEIEASGPGLGLEIVAKESYKTEETDLTAQLTKLKGSDAEVLVVWGTNPGPAVAAKNLKQLAWDVPYVGSHGIANLKFIELAGDSAEGVVFPSTKILFPESITDARQKALIETFVADYTESFGEAPNHFAAHGWDAVMLLVEAIETAGSTEAAAIRDALNGITDFAGADGIFNYSTDDHDGLSVEDLIMVRIENGRWVLAK